MDRSTVQKHKKKVVFSYLVYQYICESERKRRRYWVHPFINERYLKGAFVTDLIDLREDEQKFFNYFRMSIRSFDELAARISDALKGNENAVRDPIPPLEMIAVTLR